MAKNEVTLEWKRGRTPAALIGQLEAFESRLAGALATAGEEIGLRIQATAARLAPVDTGRLRASIDSAVKQMKEHVIRVLIGSNVEYAPTQEIQQPYLRPAIEQEREFIRRRWKQAVEDAAGPLL